MKNKNLLIIVVLILLGAGAYLVLKKQKQTDTLNPEETAFAVADTASVSRIFISDKRTGRSYDLKRTGKRDWVSQKSGTRIFWPHMDQMLATLHDLKVKRPVFDNERENAVSQIAVNHYFVEVYHKDGTVKKLFLGPETDQHTGNYAILEGKDVPYVVHIPSFQGYPGAHFAVNEVEWRDKVLFKSTPRTLQRVEVTFRDHPEENMVVKFRDKKFIFEGIEHVDTARMSEFVSVVADGYVEEFFPETKPLDSLLATAPAYKVKVEDIDPDHSPELWLYPPPGWTPGKLQSVAAVLFKGKEKLLITVQKQNFEPLVMGKSYYRKPKAKM